MSMTETIRRKLEAAFEPTELAVEDFSAAHEGHSGHSHGGETHFRLRIVSAAFTGASRLARQQAVHAALKDEMATIHALTMICLAPGE